LSAGFTGRIDWPMITTSENIFKGEQRCHIRRAEAFDRPSRAKLMALDQSDKSCHRTRIGLWSVNASTNLFLDMRVFFTTARLFWRDRAMRGAVSSRR
jgi:hypothetical protein